MMKKSKSKWSWASASPALALVAVLAGAPIVNGQQLEGQYRLIGAEVVKAFEPIRLVLQQSSAVIYEGRKEIAYGVVVSSDGYVVTKASELEDRGKLTMRINTSAYDTFEVVAKSLDWDVALLKVEAKDLVPVNWSDGAEPGHGSWVVSNGATSRMRRRLRIGVISANPREIKGGTQVVLGVTLKGENDQIVVGEVHEDSGAAVAGVKEGDVIVAADGTLLKERKDLLDILGEKEPGQKITLGIERGEEAVEIEVELRARHKVFGGPQSRNDSMSGRFSGRRTNFKRVLQHDIGLSERTVGGPLLDLDGRCVGMNIARANRSETFAVPAKELRKLIVELRDGKESKAEEEDQEN